MNALIRAIEAEYLRYKALGEGALAQVAESALCEPGPNGGNSLAVICWHVSGNLRSRFTDFLTTDGEKPWRHREEEFAARKVTRAELMEKWEQGWGVLVATLASLTDADLSRTVTVRGQSLLASEAVLRSLAHASYHVGQIVYLAHALVGATWLYLTIPPGASAAYNTDPANEKPRSHGAHARGPADAAREREQRKP